MTLIELNFTFVQAEPEFLVTVIEFNFTFVQAEPEFLVTFIELNFTFVQAEPEFLVILCQELNSNCAGGGGILNHELYFNFGLSRGGIFSH